MLQRKQTIYLFIAIVVTVIALVFPLGFYEQEGLVTGNMYNLWIITAQDMHDMVVWPLFAIQLVTLPLAVISIFAYRNRIFQSRLCSLNILLLVGWYIVFVVYTFVFNGRYNSVFHYSLIDLLPLLSIILYFIARKGIMAEEKLVRDADRIR